jgi:Ca2+-binding EF-hand superfamily protein
MMIDGPYFKERNDRMVASHVQKLIQEAVEDGVGELDLRYVGFFFFLFL